MTAITNTNHLELSLKKEGVKVKLSRLLMNDYFS